MHDGEGNAAQQVLLTGLRARVSLRPRENCPGELRSQFMTSIHASDRRRFLQHSFAAAAAVGLSHEAAAADGSLIASIEKVVLRDSKEKLPNWFHPRSCMVPALNGEGAMAFMTLQTIGGSDYFGPVHWTTSNDLGKTWSEFQPAPPLGWDKLEDGITSEAVCDVTPEYHAKTGSVLALGHNVFYKTKAFDRNQPSRWPVYAVWKKGTWGPRKKLVWDDPRGTEIYSNNCGQRVMLPDGDVLMSFTFGVKGKPRDVCGVLCSFDGNDLVIKKTGPALSNPKGRGLLEPSLTSFQKRFYLTIRAEDNRGYVAVSDDGLNYEPKQAWAWDDGQPLDMSTTQQHWLTHSDGLFLVYTRKDPTNVNVPRWRAPLWVAQVDTKTLRLVRATEKVVLPLVGDGVNDAKQVAFMGNFGVNSNVSADEAWVTDGSWCPGDASKGELQLARVRWSRKNGLVQATS